MSNILTLQIDAAGQCFFEALRQEHFPPERNHIAAHITLFHTLPAFPQVSETLAAAAACRSPFPVAVTGLRSLGKGVAYTLVSPLLQVLHRELSDTFKEHLTPQDAQRFQPHIVVQNKVTPGAARALLADLERSFHAVEITAVGLDLWHYLGGPWEHLKTFPFSRVPALPPPAPDLTS